MNLLTSKERRRAAKSSPLDIIRLVDESLQSDNWMQIQMERGEITTYQKKKTKAKVENETISENKQPKSSRNEKRSVDVQSVPFHEKQSMPQKNATLASYPIAGCVGITG